MKVFVTGASGYIGLAIVRELLEAGHQVVGLARSDASAAVLTAAGASVQRGTLEDLDVLRSAAIAADGVIHLAFRNPAEITDYIPAIQADVAAVETFGAALQDTGKPFVNTSGTFPLSILGRLATEEDVSTAAWVRPSENITVALAERGVRSSVVRPAPSVHGEGDKNGFLPALIGIARAKGVSAYVGDGSNRWPAVHRRDAARLYRLAVEAAPASSRLHAVAEEGIPFREIAEAIGRQLNLPVVSIAAEDVANHFSFMALFVSADNPTSSALTRQRLGWQPEEPGLIADIEQGHYFTDKT